MVSCVLYIHTLTTSFSMHQHHHQQQQNNAWNRLNSVSVFGLTVLGYIGALAAVTTFWLEGTATDVVVQELSLQRFTPLKHPIYSERVDLTFKLKADLTPLNHWNVKQVFAYVVAQYETDTHDINQIIIWDKIIRTDCEEHSESHPHLDVWCFDDSRLLNGEDIYNKYHLLHPRKQLRGTDITLSFHYDIMPIVGSVFPTTMPSNFFNERIRRSEAFDTTFTLPEKYSYETKYF